jgi:FAD/FMN-containing dehydrogenase
MNAAYLSDASGFTGWAEEAFAPADEAGVVEILRRATEQRIPVTIAGAGSGLTGARVPQGGWVLSLERFRKLDIGPGRARAGAAVTLLELREAAAPTRQFYAPDPTELTASVGGTIATNASGSRSFRFGATRRHVLGLRVALIDGRVVEYRRGDKLDFDAPAIPLPRTTKCTAGYRLEPGMDWIDLFCGSEGTLGVVLEAELQLLPAPEHVFAGVIFFACDDDALRAVDLWRGAADLRMLEYADRNSLNLLRGRYPEIPAAAAAALLIEAEGQDLDAWENRLREAAAMVDASWFAASARERERFRLFRHALPETVNAAVLSRGFMKMGADYAVPLDQNREMIAYYRERLERELPGQYVIYGHIGDAHVHVNMLPATPQQAALANALLTEFARQAVALGGAVSAEHGLGKRKAHLLAIQYAPEHIQAMMNVKRRLDPFWLLGRGTLFPLPDWVSTSLEVAHDPDLR